MRRTIIEITKDGPRILPDPGATMVMTPPPELLVAAGGTPPPPPDFHAGAAAGLGSFFDALVNKGGIAPAAAQEMLWAAWENLKGRLAA